jgi:predicted nucleic acid-binding protein
MILVDTNIPLRLAHANHPHRQAALDALRTLAIHTHEQFAIAPQSLYEMYVVFTRPTGSNGFGYTPQQAHAQITACHALFELLPESAQTYSIWENLIL